MPTSDIHSVPAIIQMTMSLSPRKVLDIGAGSGKYGALLREYLEIAHTRLYKHQWRSTIDAVEGFPDYLTNLHFHVYDSIYVHDFTKHYETYRGYDLVLMIDSLEHVDKETGTRILRTLRDNNKNVIVSCPFGDNYLEQGAVNGNEFERHRAHWTPDEFRKLGGRRLYEGVCAVYLFY